MVRPGLTLAERLAYVFAPPGWSHDGSRLDSAALKAAEQASRPAPGIAPQPTGLAWAKAAQG